MNSLVTQLKEENQDFEWYPTTNEIIEAIKKDIEGQRIHHEDFSVLDCGAGDGRVLNALTKGRKYAIEKSKPLLSALSRDIFVVGTDLQQQTLIDKKADIVFSNPPYSEFEGWASKIITEARSKLVYLVIPDYWKRSVLIEAAIEARSAEATVINSFDFLNAERKARANVDVIRIDLQFNPRFKSSYSRSGESITDPFTLWFNNNFTIGAQNKHKDAHSHDPYRSATQRERVDKALVAGSDIVSVLEQLYNEDLTHLIQNYRSLEELDVSILNELNVNMRGLREAFNQKIVNMKDRYWRELFDNLDRVTNRLTKKSREALLETLTAHTHVDFTVLNAHAILEWVVKNANHYLDDQLTELVERMVGKANVVLYKSNARTFGDDDWRYCRRPEKLDKYKLEYRVVLSNVGGIAQGYWESSRRNLAERAGELLNDICSVANNIGFDTTGLERYADYEWVSNKSNSFYFKHPRTGEKTELMSVKAFKNGNLHIKFNQAFMCKLNVEFGRLKGWVKTAKEASSELDIPIKSAELSFNSQIKLGASTIPLLTQRT